MVALGPDKVGVGEEVRVGVAGRDAYPLRTLGDRPLPVLRPEPSWVTLVSATYWWTARVDVLLVLGRRRPLGPTHAKDKALAAMMSPVDIDPSSMLEPAWRVTTSNLFAA